MIRANPSAGSPGRTPDHVLPGRISGGVVEAQVSQRADRVLLDLDQLPDAGGRLGGGGDLVVVLGEPHAEFARLERIVEHEHRRSLHAVVDHRCPHATGLAEQPHAPVVTGHERALGGRQRDVVVARRMLTVDSQRSGKTDRNLRDADEVFDIARKHRRVE